MKSQNHPKSNATAITTSAHRDPSKLLRFDMPRDREATSKVGQVLNAEPSAPLKLHFGASRRDLPRCLMSLCLSHHRDVVPGLGMGLRRFCGGDIIKLCVRCEVRSVDMDYRCIVTTA
jgi:hypothetical protein